jgi:hypothetical protein
MRHDVLIIIVKRTQENAKIEAEHVVEQGQFLCKWSIEQKSRKDVSRTRRARRWKKSTIELFSDDDLDRTLENGPSAAARQGSQEDRQIQRIRRRGLIVVNGHFRPYCSLDGVYMVSDHLFLLLA